MNMKTNAVFISALLALAATGSAQSTSLKRDITFIRGLVTDLRFIDLAKFETENLGKKYTEGDEFKQVVALKIEVSLEGAKRHPDRGERRDLYQQAVEQLDQFLERYAGDNVAFEARKTLATACIEFGRFLIEELELARVEAPEKVAELEEQAGKVFRKGAEATQSVMAKLRADGKETEIDFFIAWLRRGMLLREHGHAVKKDRTYLCEQAKEVLEELVLEIGEETALGQKALFEMAQISEVEGNLDEAASSYNDTVEQIIESLDNAADLNLSEAVQRLMFDLLQEVYDHLCEVYFQQGKTDEVLKVLAKYRQNLKDYGAQPHNKFGDSLFLMEARVLAESGKQTEVTKALATAKAINKKHPNDFVGLRAKNLLDVILTRSSNLVTGDVLLEIAKGYYQEKKYDLAIAGLKEALRGMTAEDRNKFGLESWNLMGRSNYALDRYLEAAMCFSKGLEAYGDLIKEQDPNLTKAIANRADLAMSKALKAAGNDPVLVTLKGRVGGLVAKFNEEKRATGDYAQGLRFYRSRKFKEAATQLGKVQPAFEKYELAQGYRAMCLLLSKQYGELKKLSKAYEAYQKSHKLSEDDRVRRAIRPQARAWVHYAEGRALYDEARGTAGSGKEDLTKYPAVIKHFLGFEQEHSDSAENQMTKANEVLGLAYLKTGDVVRAEGRYQKLKATNKHKFLGNALFRYHQSQVKALEKERDGIQKGGGNTKAIDARLNDARQKTLAQGMDYARTLGDPNYDVMFMTMKLAEEQEQWTDCEWVATKILKLYSKDKRVMKDPSFPRVKPALGNALLHQPAKLQQALDILTEAEKDFIAKKKDNTVGYFEVVRLSCLAMGGWARFDAQGNYHPSGGMGDPVNAYNKFYGPKYRKYALSDSRGADYTLPWYRYHLEAYYFARQAAKVDNKFAGHADKLFSIAKSTDNFESLKKLGPEGDRIYDLFQRIQ